MSNAKRLAARPSHLDPLRAFRAGELLRDGLGPAEAMWRVMTDPKLGYRKWKGSTGRRPCERSLVRKLTRLLERGAPDVVDSARDAARAVLASSAVQAATTIARTAEGDHPDYCRAGELQLLASVKLLEGLGVIEKGGPRAVAIAGAGAMTIEAEEAHRRALDEAEKLVEGLDYEVSDSGEA